MVVQEPNATERSALENKDLEAPPNDLEDNETVPPDELATEGADANDKELPPSAAMKKSDFPDGIA
jgi:hypothetical protein